MLSKWSLCVWLALNLLIAFVLGGGLRSSQNKYIHYNEENKIRSLGSSGAVDPFRKFVGEAILRLPEDIEASENVGFTTFDMNISDFRCFDLSYGDITIDSFQVEAQDYVQIQITEFMFKCSFNVSWSYGWADGESSVYVTSNKNYLTTKMATKYDAFGGDEFDMEPCEGTIIALDELVFDGDISRILTLYRGFIRRIAESRLKEEFCEILSQEMLGLVLYEVEETLSNYTDELPAWRNDPLLLESSETVDSNNNVTNGTIFDLQNDLFMAVVLGNLNRVYAELQQEPNATSEKDDKDFGLNIILREKFLEEDGSFLFIDEGDEVSEPKRTQLVDINATINSMNIYNLDTATVSPVSVIGSKTIQTNLFWESISIRMNATLEVSASSVPDSFFENGDEMQPIVENVVVVVAVDNISATISLVLPLERDVVESLPEGYILNWRDLPPCIPPVLFNISVSGLVVDIGSIHQPTINGIVSQEIDMLVQKGVGIGVPIFEEQILEAIPGIFQTEIRDIANEALQYFHCP
jgi:hypothetical protein